jgi:hypothetical protein
MTYTDVTSDGVHHIRLSKRPAPNSIAALRDYLEQCDHRRIAPDTHLSLSAEDRLTRDDIVTALPLCINIIRIGTTLAACRAYRVTGFCHRVHWFACRPRTPALE